MLMTSQQLRRLCVCVTAGGQARPAPLHSGTVPCTQQSQTDALRHVPLVTAQSSGRDCSSTSSSASPGTLWSLSEPGRGGNSSDRSEFCPKSPQMVF